MANQFARSDDKNQMSMDGVEVLQSGSCSLITRQATLRSGKMMMNIVKLNNNSFTYGSHGGVSVKGRRTHMEDAVTVELGFLRESKKYDYFGVYDGHGGPEVAFACRDELHHLVVKQMEGEEGEIIDWEKVMVASFLEMDGQVIACGYATRQTGSTAIVAVVGEQVLVVANCGDSRAVLYTGDVAVPMSTDHKADQPDEIKRIEMAGGHIIYWHRARVLGVLKPSRAIGNKFLKPYVIAEAEVTVKTRTAADEFMILASDGLWDVLSNEKACHIVRRCLKAKVPKKIRVNINNNQELVLIIRENGIESRCAQAARILETIAMALGSQDNISVVWLSSMNSVVTGSFI